MRVCPLASGSSGNVTWIEGNEGAILVDAGLPSSQIRDLVSMAGLDLARLKAVFITHEHADHWRGADGLGKDLGIPIFLTAGTARSLEGRLGKTVKTSMIQPGNPVTLAGMVIHPHAVIHDAREPVCYSITEGDSCSAVVTDLGQPDAVTAQVLAKAQILLFEANYDPKMLTEGPYPR
ncbi:MAG: MBL fold metallo-hydrolase, partial [Planctomycetota bacterium]